MGGGGPPVRFVMASFARAWENLVRARTQSIWSIMSVLVEFSCGGIECKWCACLRAGSLNDIGAGGAEGGCGIRWAVWNTG